MLVCTQQLHFVFRLICDSKSRFTVEDLKAHEFFKSLDWKNIRSQTACIVPQVHVVLAEWALLVSDAVVFLELGEK